MGNQVDDKPSPAPSVAPGAPPGVRRDEWYSPSSHKASVVRRTACWDADSTGLLHFSQLTDRLSFAQGVEVVFCSTGSHLPHVCQK